MIPDPINPKRISTNNCRSANRQLSSRDGTSISVSCNPHNIPIKFHPQSQYFHHKFSSISQCHSQLFNSFPQPNYPQYQLNIPFSFHSQFSQKHTHNSVPISLSHYPRTTTITIQDNVIYVYVYKLCHSPLYENNPA